MPMEKSLLKDHHQNHATTISASRIHHHEDFEDQSFVALETEKEVLKGVSTPSFMASLNTPFEALDFGASAASAAAGVSSSPRPPPSFFGCFSSKNKRVSEDETNNEESRGDRRHKRMMKNRESAARSRARRQAYTSELEREIAELLEENAKLRKHQIELLLSAPAGIPKKSTHNRSFTAPF